MRVLLVTHYYPEHRSGIELVAGELAGRLARRGFAIEWAASAVPPQGGGPGTVVRLPMPAWNWTERRLGVPYPIWGPAALVRLARAVRRCDVVHLHDSLYVGNGAAFLLAKLAGKPVLVTQHIGLVPYKSSLLRGLMTLANHTVGRLVLTGADGCVFISAQVQSYFTRRLRFRRPPRFIANGVDAAVFHPLGDVERRRTRAELGWPADRPALLFVGRFVEKKGLPLLRVLAERFPECLWAFVGWGPEAPDRWGLPNVVCLGGLPQCKIAACYQAADLLVLPSVGEGFPLVVQEAMACGTPALISTETVGGYPAVEPLVYSAEPRPEAMTAKVRQILADPAALAARRAAVASFAREHWDWERCADRYAEIVRGLVTPVRKQLARSAGLRAKS
jgi:glycosyltransferase involved in cell wall biosynthesis